MSVFYGGERTQSALERVILIVMFGSYVLAAFKHESPLPILYGLGLLLVIAIIYYIPLRILYWLFTGDGEITSRVLIFLPYIFLTLMGLMMLFSGPEVLQAS